MSLTVRQVHQYSAAFKQQLDQFEGETSSNDQTVGRIESLFKQMQPQLEALSKSVDARSQDLSDVDRKLLIGQETVDYLARETRDIDAQCSQASRVSEALKQPVGGRVFSVPSALTDHYVTTLQRHTQSLAQLFVSS